MLTGNIGEAQFVAMSTFRLGRSLRGPDINGQELPDLTADTIGLLKVQQKRSLSAMFNRVLENYEPESIQMPGNYALDSWVAAKGGFRRLLGVGDPTYDVLNDLNRAAGHGQH